jgi:hypothetical protein
MDARCLVPAQCFADHTLATAKDWKSYESLLMQIWQVCGPMRNTSV